MTLLPDLPNCIDPDDWEDFKAHRKEIKKPLTGVAEKRLIRKLVRLHQEGQDIGRMLEQSIINGWQDVWPCDLRETGDDLANRYIAEALEDDRPRIQTEAGDGGPTVERHGGRLRLAVDKGRRSGNG